MFDSSACCTDDHDTENQHHRPSSPTRRPQGSSQTETSKGKIHQRPDQASGTFREGGTSSRGHGVTTEIQQNMGAKGEEKGANDKAWGEEGKLDRNDRIG